MLTGSCYIAQKAGGWPFKTKLAQFHVIEIHYKYFKQLQLLAVSIKIHRDNVVIAS